MIVTLLITIVVEGAIVIAYAVRMRKPTGPLLLTSILGNLLTQSLLWILLTLFFRQYLLNLLLAEILVWGLESLLFYGIPANHLDLRESALLSLGLNLASLAIGWFLPV